MHSPYSITVIINKYLDKSIPNHLNHFKKGTRKRTLYYLFRIIGGMVQEIRKLVKMQAKREKHLSQNCCLILILQEIFVR